MNHERLHVGHVGQQREDAQVIDEGPGRFLTALNLESEDGASAIGEEAGIERVVGMAVKGGVVHPLHLRVVGQIVYNLPCVVGMTLHTQTERFESLEQYPGVERADGGTGVAQEYGPDAGGEGCRTGHIGKHSPVIGWVGLGQCGIFVGIGFPVELSGVDDDTSKRRSVASDKLGGRVYHHIGSMLDGA